MAIPLLALVLLAPVAASEQRIGRYLLQSLPQEQGAASVPAPERAGWLADTELRGDWNDSGDYSLALRFRPGGRSRGEAEYRVQQLEIAGDRQAVLIDRGQVLLEGYRHILEIVESQAKLDSLEAEYRLEGDRLAYQRALVESEAFRVEGLQRAELSRERILREIEITRLELAALLASVDEPADGSRILDDRDTQLVAWRTMIDGIDEMDWTDSGSAIPGDADGIELRLARERLALERRDRDRWVDFVEVKLRRLDSGDQEAGVGVAIPLGSRAVGSLRRSLELNRAERQWRAGLHRRADLAWRAQRELDWRFREAGLLDRRREELRARLGGLRNLDRPQLLFAIREEILAVGQQRVRSRLRGVEIYLELLADNGLLASPPLRNWMLRDQPLLEANGPGAGAQSR